MRNLLAFLTLACVLAAIPALAQPAGHPRDVLGEIRAARACKAKAPCRKPKRPHADFRGQTAMIDAAATNEGILADLARALVRVESGGDPARRGRHGEIGLTQIKCQTARGLGFAGPCAALFDPATNLKWGLRHARLALARGSIGFHQTGLHARRVSVAYVARINAAMR